MPQTVMLLKPFVLSRPPTMGKNLPSEKKFTPRQNPQTKEWIPTEITLSDEDADHWYIKDHFADGAIERPEVAAARIAAAEAKRQKQDEEDARQAQIARDLMKRASGSHAVQQVNNDATEGQINTPVNALRAQSGKDVDKPISQTEHEDALNTPVDQLAAGTTKSGKKV